MLNLPDMYGNGMYKLSPVHYMAYHMSHYMSLFATLSHMTEIGGTANPPMSPGHDGSSIASDDECGDAWHCSVYTVARQILMPLVI